MIFIVGRAGSLRGNHAGAGRIQRVADAFEQKALVWSLYPPQDIAAAATINFYGTDLRHFKFF
jgi:hypothetical protein